MTASMSWEVDREHEEFRASAALPKTHTGKIMRRLLRDVVEYGGQRGDISAMEDLAGLEAVQQAVGVETAPIA